MMPDHEDHHDPDMTPGTASAMQKIASGLGLVAGIALLVAFGLSLGGDGDANWLFLALGVFFLAFPILLRRLLP